MSACDPGELHRWMEVAHGVDSERQLVIEDWHFYRFSLASAPPVRCPLTISSPARRLTYSPAGHQPAIAPPARFQPDVTRALPHQPNFSQTSSSQLPYQPDFIRSIALPARLHPANYPTSQASSGQLPHQPDFIRPLPHQPDFIRPLPDQPDFIRPLPHQPDFIRPLPRQPDFIRPLPHQPDFSQTSSGHSPASQTSARHHPAIAPPARLQQVFMRPLLRQPDFIRPLPHQPDFIRPLLRQPDLSQTSSDPCPAYQSINSFAWPSRAPADSITLSLLRRFNCDTPAARRTMISQLPGPGIHQLTVPSPAPCASLEALTPLRRRFSRL